MLEKAWESLGRAGKLRKWGGPAGNAWESLRKLEKGGKLGKGGPCWGRWDSLRKLEKGGKAGKGGPLLGPLGKLEKA